MSALREAGRAEHDVPAAELRLNPFWVSQAISGWAGWIDVERHADLSRRAQSLLEQLGYRNIIFKIGDGSLGWESWAPYDRIIVTAGAPVVSEKLKAQLDQWNAEAARTGAPTWVFCSSMADVFEDREDLVREGVTSRRAELVVVPAPIDQRGGDADPRRLSVR